MKINNIGLIFGLIYFVIVLVFVIWANTLSDPKSQFVILQLPLAVQMAGLHEMGILKYLTGMSWVGTYIFIGIPTLLFFYFIGCLFDKIFSGQ